MLDDLGPGPAVARPQRGTDAFDQLLREIVAPYTEPKPDPRQAELVAQVDETVSAQMSAILHHPEFQSLEAAWRGLFFLVRRLETGSALKLYILDITKAELAGAAEKLYELIVEQSVGTPGAEPWALLAGLYTFDNSPEDLEPLRGAGKMARAAGAPFLAAASPRILGCESLAASPDPTGVAAGCRRAAGYGRRCGARRRRPSSASRSRASCCGCLTAPAPIPPNGSTSRRCPAAPITRASFGATRRWPAWRCSARASAKTAGTCGRMRCRDVQGLPAYLYKQDGEPVLQPCAEALLTERAADAIMEKGLMPLLTVKGSDRARLARFQSIADPPTALAGRWG